jgi:anaerobic magnesium-protoporphyrin IX monomethyl ester cyclase
MKDGNRDCGEILLREFTAHEPREQILAALLAEEPDVIAFSVYLWNRRQTLELADALTVARPGLRVVIGGPEVSFDGPELFVRHPGVSALVRGEGEIPLRSLLTAWAMGKNPDGVMRLLWRSDDGVMNEGPDGPSLADLDALPSPFEHGLVDLSRGLVYYETSRGCPYNCSFCLSALDPQVRSFSLQRICSDLDWLLDRRVPIIKLVDRTFNYDAERARRIWSFILEHNRESRFHFEIGAHLLDDASLELLAKVPEGMFQFEVGVQSTLPAALLAVDRRASLERLEENVARLRRVGNIHLHLDLIAGLPGERYRPFLASIDRVAALQPHHLQVEAVKLLPGSPLRRQAKERQIRFDPHPPYTVLATPDLSFSELQRLAGISRLLDLTWNNNRLPSFLDGLAGTCDSLAEGMERMEEYFRRNDLFRHPLSQRAFFEHIGEFVQTVYAGEDGDRLRELLARDYARNERVVPDNAPGFFAAPLTTAEAQRVQQRVKEETAAVQGKGIKVQHFAAVFSRLPEYSGRTVLLFIYLIRAGEGMKVREIPLCK